MARITLEGVSKRFPDGSVAVRDVSFEVEDGELFVLVGPSGCGKSTLLHLVVGLEEPSSGTIAADGRVLNGVDPKDRNMALVFQSYALYPHLTVRENLAFPLRIARRPAAEIERRVREAAELLELEDLLDRRPAGLSGGQRQRVAMGRAIVREPAVFLMDEPLSNLDARLRHQMRTEIARLQRRLATTLIYVTHDQAEAMTLSDRLAVMEAGAIQQIGTPRELYERPATRFVAGFFGAPAMNFLEAEPCEGGLRLPELGVELRRPAPTRPCVAGLRPEHLVEAGRAAPGACRFRALLVRLEWLGADAYAHVEPAAGQGGAPPEAPAGGARTTRSPLIATRSPLIARLDAATTLREGEPLELAFDPERLHLFDAATGARLD